jgi:hypothetical protein
MEAIQKWAKSLRRVNVQPTFGFERSSIDDAELAGLADLVHNDTSCSAEVGINFCAIGSHDADAPAKLFGSGTQDAGNRCIVCSSNGGGLMAQFQEAETDARCESAARCNPPS